METAKYSRINHVTGMDLAAALSIIGFLLLVILLSGLFLLQVVFRIIRHWYHFPIPSFMIQFIDNPLRRRFIQSPEVAADRMGLLPGMRVVEIGPGKGSYTFAFARRVTLDGVVYACDIQKDVVDRLRERARREGVSNVDARIDNAHAFSFPDDSIDRVIALSCLAEIPDPVKVLKECKRILKPGGLVCLTELLPDPDYPFRGTEKGWAAEAGLELAEEFGGFFAYQLHFRKPVTA